jgi:hypothetical protein
MATTNAGIPSRWRARIADGGVIVGLAVLLIAVVVVVLAVFGNPPVLQQLRDAAYARGVITFLITLGTICIAIVLVSSALFSAESTDERFRRAREVFSVLAGVLGTIVGFYFGSTDGTRGSLSIDTPQVIATAQGSQLVARISGGVPPYTYTVEVNGEKVLEQQTSPDGSILADLPSVGPDAEVKVLAVDHEGRRAEGVRGKRRPAPPSPGVSPSTGPTTTPTPRRN